MAAALLELEQILLSKQVPLTGQESNILMNYKANCLKDLIIGGGAGGIVSWIATGMLNAVIRINVVAGVAAATGVWKFHKTVDSCVEDIISLNGSKIQQLMGNIILENHTNDPWLMQLINKHFYVEKVYDDSSSRQPKLRWRYRNFYISDDAQFSAAHDSSFDDPKAEEIADQPKKIFDNPIGFAFVNVLDCIYGLPGATIGEETVSGSAVKRESHSHHRRYHRRHRKRNYHEGSKTSHHDDDVHV
ncbi:uncharacterized protein LOC124935731 [Impatiens glandulifera]|uniref:uncharacterized protein LOC124935731 n=1 Tax=Impatiens glandulifera TaxID=253017 RepID=UPI001FB0A848|nr:uncharacterized protein LOC124935731 [Impatiens glandulifera]